MKLTEEKSWVQKMDSMLKEIKEERGNSSKNTQQDERKNSC